MVDYLAGPVTHDAFFRKYASKKFLKGEQSPQSSHAYNANSFQRLLFFVRGPRSGHQSCLMVQNSKLADRRRLCNLQLSRCESMIISHAISLHGTCCLGHDVDLQHINCIPGILFFLRCIGVSGDGYCPYDVGAWRLVKHSGYKEGMTSSCTFIGEHNGCYLICWRTRSRREFVDPDNSIEHFLTPLALD